MSADQRDIDILAGEYVLGVLSEEARAAVEARLATDARLMTAVRRAREQFLELDLTAAAAPAPANGWEALAARLDETPPATDLAANVVTLRPAARPSSRFWQGFGTASLAAGLLMTLAAGLVWQKVLAPQPAVIVVLLDAQSKPGAIIEAFADDSVRVVPLEKFDVPSDRVIQLWTLPDAKTGPVSLGLIPTLQELRLTGPKLPAPQPDQLYEFTMEPAGGSPTGRPTGPILGKGLARRPI